MSRFHARRLVNLAARIDEILTSLVSYRRTFVSNVNTGTGSAQEIAHGLGATPNKFIVVPHTGHNGAGAAGTQVPSFTVGTVDATKITVTCSTAATYYVVAWRA